MRIVDDVVFDVQNDIDADFCSALGIDVVFEVVNHIDFPQPRHTKIDLPITPDDEQSQSRSGIHHVIDFADVEKNRDLIFKYKSEAEWKSTKDTPVGTPNGQALKAMQPLGGAGGTSPTNPNASHGAGGDAPPELELPLGGGSDKERTQYEKDLGLDLADIQAKAQRQAIEVPYYSTNVILTRFLENKDDFVARQNKRGPEPGLKDVDKKSLKA